MMIDKKPWKQKSRHKSRDDPSSHETSVVARVYCHRLSGHDGDEGDDDERQPLFCLL